MDAALIGRERELAVLGQSIARVERGQGRTLLLSGEAGIGKSRLAAHAVAMARDRGFSVLSGQAAPLASSPNGLISARSSQRGLPRKVMFCRF